MARFLVRCCLVVAYWLTLSAPVSGLSDVIEYRIIEGQPANTLIGNVPVDAGLHTMYTAQTLTSFRYQLLSTDSDIEQGSHGLHYRPKGYYRPSHRHSALQPSSLSVCLSRGCPCLENKKYVKDSEIDMKVARFTCNSNPFLRSKGQRSSSQDRIMLRQEIRRISRRDGQTPNLVEVCIARGVHR